ncbi:MAG: class I SAM-dependent methyltransferase [Desulforhopalus sp.]|nr:class I SAM-dependent methyltransferase [Desulforhopalus sp.]
MKRCLSCDARYLSSMPHCQRCGVVDASVHGFDAYAPNLAFDGGGFNPNYFSELAQLENANFWFQYRNKLILWVIEHYHPTFQLLLEIGCGTGYVLTCISKSFPEAKLSGSEIYVAGLEFAAARLPSAKFMQMDARNIPFENEFDLIGAFDVLEHIKEDEDVLTQMYAALKPNGIMLLTVPQHEWLWSPTDEYAFHVRRYTAADIHKKVEKAGFRIIRSTSFITTLLPVMMISRFWQKRVSGKLENTSAELKISLWLNVLFSRLLSPELALIQKGVNFPIGGSRIVVAKKL